MYEGGHDANCASKNKETLLLPALGKTCIKHVLSGMQRVNFRISRSKEKERSLKYFDFWMNQLEKIEKKKETKKILFLRRMEFNSVLSSRNNRDKTIVK